jgi:capsular exopolysaccharide synthesis family protein
VLVRRRVFILSTVCIIALSTTIVTLLLPNIYEGKTVLIPLGKSPNSLQTALGALGNLLPSGMVGNEDPAVRLLAILQSRTLAEDIIHRLDLLLRLFPGDWDATAQQWKTDEPPTLQDAVKALQEDVATIVRDEKKGTITITAQHTDPELAAAIANQHIEALQRALNGNAFSLAKKNRLFIEAQLQRTQGDLVTAEEAVRQFEQTYGILALDMQAQAAVNALANLEGQIMAKEVQLAVMQRTLTGSSREVSLLQEELQGLRAQLTRLQQGTTALFPASETRGQNGQSLPSLDRAPEIRLQYARLQREALLQNKLFTLLTEQLEQARIEEARDETAFQLLDKAIPPEKKSKPRRALIIVLSTIMGTFVGIFVTFLREFLNTAVRTREQVERQAGMSLLATIPPAVQPPRHRRQRRQPPLEAPVGLSSFSDPLRSEAFRYLHTRLKRSNGTHGIQTLVLTSPHPEEETAATLVNLALVTAGIGEKTLLVDSNLRSPTLHNLLQCPSTPGLADILTDPEGWQQGIHATRVNNLHLLPAGVTTPQGLVSLESSAFDALLARLRSHYDTVLFATPPVLSCTDAAVLSTKVDATCLVLTCGVSRLEAISEAKATLEAVQGKVIGAILTDFRM